MFIGRDFELKSLLSSTKPRRATLIVCRGRRRVGKSRLIEEFGKSFPRFVRFQGLAPIVADSDYFDTIITMSELLNGNI